MQVSDEVILLAHNLRLAVENGDQFHRNFRANAEKLGWTVLGRGFYGAAFKHPSLPGVVAKVGLNPSDGWPEYARWCRAHPEYWGLGILPVYYLHRNKDYQYVALIKELEETNTSETGYDPEYCALRVALGASSSAYANSATLEVLQSDEFRPTKKAVQACAGYFRGSAETDLHAGNVMRDPDTGRLIMTDPYGESDVSTRDEEDEEAEVLVPYPVDDRLPL